ncbi:MAG: hypothetical protein ACI8W8_000466 [Rhodothermales bacterium]
MLVSTINHFEVVDPTDPLIAGALANDNRVTALLGQWLKQLWVDIDKDDVVAARGEYVSEQAAADVSGTELDEGFDSGPQLVE